MVMLVYQRVGHFWTKEYFIPLYRHKMFGKFSAHVHFALHKINQVEITYIFIFKSAIALPIISHRDPLFIAYTSQR